MMHITSNALSNVTIVWGLAFAVVLGLGYTRTVAARWLHGLLSRMNKASGAWLVILAGLVPASAWCLNPAHGLLLQATSLSVLLLTVSPVLLGWVLNVRSSSVVTSA